MTNHTDFYSHEATELELYVMNDAGAYNAYYMPVVRNLERKWRKGTFNLDLAIKGMTHAVNAAAKSYRLEHGSMTDAWFRMFPKADRDRVAEALVRDLVDEWRSGNTYLS